MRDETSRTPTDAAGRRGHWSMRRERWLALFSVTIGQAMGRERGKVAIVHHREDRRDVLLLSLELPA